MKIRILSLFILCLATIACDKDKHGPDLPPITTTGANTFGCRINGKVWVPSKRPKGDLPQIEGGIVTRGRPDGTVDINWYKLLIFTYSDNTSGFQLFLSRINSPGEYPLYYTDCVFPSCLSRPNYVYYYEGENEFSALSQPESKLNLLRYDTINKIFSGTFSFKAKIFNGNRVDTINVTDGRFDIDQTKIN